MNEQSLRPVASELRKLREDVERLRSLERFLSNARELGGIRRDGPGTAWTKNTDAWEDFGGTDYFERVFTKQLENTHLFVDFDVNGLHDSGTDTTWELGLELAGTGEVGGPWKWPINPELQWVPISGWFKIGAQAPGAGDFTLTLRVRRIVGTATLSFSSTGRAAYRVREVASGLSS